MRSFSGRVRASSRAVAAAVVVAVAVVGALVAVEDWAGAGAGVRVTTRKDGVRTAEAVPAWRASVRLLDVAG